MMRGMGRISVSSLRWAMLAAITALAAVLRLWQINESLWVDELHTSWCVQGSLSQVAERAAAGNQSPLYFWLLWGVTHLGGESEFTLRLPSLLAGIALPGVTWLLVRQLQLGDRTDIAALLGAALVCVDHTSLFYSTEARPYALVELLGAVALLLAMESLRGGGFLVPLGLVASLLTLFYLHYTTALFVAAILSCFPAYAALTRRENASWWNPWIMVGGATLLLCLPATYQLLEIAGRRESWSFFVDTHSATADMYFVLVILLVLWIPRPLASLLLSASVCLLPALLAWCLTWWKIAPLFHTRYIVATTPVLWASMGAAAQFSKNSHWRQLASLAVLAIALWWSGWPQNCLNGGKLLTDRQEDWRSAIAAARQEHQTHPTRKILVHSGLIETDALRQPHDAQLVEYGLLPVKALYQLPAEEDDLIPLPMSHPGLLTGETRAEILSAGGAIFIMRLSAADARNVEEDLNQSFAEQNAAVCFVLRRRFGNVQMLTIQTTAKPRQTPREVSHRLPTTHLSEARRVGLQTH